MIDRREFLRYVPATTAVGLFDLASKVSGAEAVGSAGLNAIESLMRGHGLLMRAVIIYDVSKDRIFKGQTVDPSLILKTASVFHDYLEEFHEKMEEKYIFASLEKERLHFASIQELKIQHGTGYELTSRITSLTKNGKQASELGTLLDDFVKMYRHHAAWEDTVIFPAFDFMEKKSDLSELSATFDLEENKILGHSGFRSFLNQIADVEKQLGIYELSTSTPRLL